MPTARITSKGQITIPSEVRKELGLETGSRVRFVRLDNGVYELAPATGTVTALKGCIPAPARPVTMEEMDAAIADAASARITR